MIMPRGQQLLLPVNAVFIVISLLLCLAVNLVPLGRWVWMPDLLMVLNSINCSLDNIEKHLNRAYFETWRYIQVRIGYWKEKVYRTKTKRELIDDAFGRWRQSGKLDY